MNKQILAKLAVWWMEMPEDALDDSVKSYAKLDILASAVPELLVENARLRAIIDEFMGLEGGQDFPPSSSCAYAMPWARWTLVIWDGDLNWQRFRSNVSGDEICPVQGIEGWP